MSKKLALRAAKLSSEAQKLKTSSNVCIAYEHQPKDPEERRHGILFAVIDLNGNPKNLEDLIELIIDTFHGEYYQDLDREPLESFENALAKINEELGDYTSSGHTSWMGKLNAILAVFANDTIHISQAGKAEAYLYRSGKESHITDDLAGDSVNPLRTFVNITSGELTEGDKIAILSSGILVSCSPAELSEFVTKYQSKVAINHLADLIEGVGGSYGQNAAILIDFLSPEALANETLDDEPDEVWLQGTTKKEILAEQTGSILQKVFKYLRLASLALGEFYTNTLSPKVIAAYKLLAAKSGEMYKNHAGKGKTKHPVLMDTEEEIDGFEREEVPEESLGSDMPETEEAPAEEEEDSLKKPSYKSEIRIKESDESPNKARLVKTKNTILNNLGALYGSATKLANIKSRKKKLPKLPQLKKNQYLIIGVIVILIFIPSAFLTYRGRVDAKNKKDAQAKLREVDSDIARANVLAGQSQKQQAVSLLNDARKLAESVAGGKYLASDGKQEIQKIDTQIASITQTTPANAAVFSSLQGTLSSEMVGIYALGNYFYAIGRDGSMAKINKASGKVSAIQLDGKIKGNVIAATAISQLKTIEILTDEPGVYEFYTGDNSITAKSASGGWEKGVDIDSYGTSLYILSGDKNQIYKHIKTAGGYGKGSTYLADKASLVSPLSMKIDSDIYVLASSGNILKYTSGAKQDFNASNIPVSLSAANFLYTDAATKDILVGSKSDKSVVIIGKDGSYLGRYTSDKFSDLKNIYVDGSTVYAVTKSQILSFNIK